MTYRQLTPAERYMLAALRRQGYNKSQDRTLALGRYCSPHGLPRAAPQQH